MKTQFNLTRMLLFMKRQVFLNIHVLLIAAGAVFGTLIMISAFVAYISPQNISGLPILYNVAFFASGFVFTSRVFSELHTPQKSYAYLTLPVSVTEKLAGTWLQSSVLFVTTFKVICIVIYFLTCLIGNKTEIFSQVFSLGELERIGVFMVIQTIFFLGAVYFRKNNFLKTIFVLFIFNMAIALFSLLFSFTLFRNIPHQGSFNISVNELLVPSKQAMYFAFWVLLGPYMLLVSYFRLKERQV